MRKCIVDLCYNTRYECIMWQTHTCGAFRPAATLFVKHALRVRHMTTCVCNALLAMRAAARCLPPAPLRVTCMMPERRAARAAVS